MSEAFLTNTSTQGLSPLGTAPQRSYELISGTVRDKLGARHAALFAEPVATQYGDRFDWYAVVSGKPKRLDALEEDEKSAVELDLAALLADIQTLGQGLLENANPDEQRLGEALFNAVRYPGEDCVYVLKDGDQYQPVLLNWAWISDSQTVVTADLSGNEGATQARKAATAAKVAAPVPPMPQTQNEDRRRGPLSLWWLLWLGWLLLLMLIAAILFLMIEACALKIPSIPGYCPPPGPIASDQERETMFLRDRIATVERQIAIADRACQPKEQASLEPDADQARLASRGAREGELTVSLFWDSIADLDLHLKCPSGPTINFRNKAACGGNLDVDSNVNQARAVMDPVENIYFDTPQAGSYSISVQLYDLHNQPKPQNFRVRVRQGDTVENYTGQVVQTRGTWTKTIVYGRGN